MCKNLFCIFIFCIFCLVQNNVVLATQSCLPEVSVEFNSDFTTVSVTSDKQLSNVVLQFCDGSVNYKFDNLSLYTQIFSYESKVISGVWVKSGCNQSNDGPGYGVFFKSDTSCKDCAGIPGGNARVDECGVCGGDGSSCADCAGVPNGSSELDECGVCGGDNSTCAGCDGTPNSKVLVDECGVCGGDGTSCADCQGNPNGDAKIDVCGVCAGDNSTCKDCSGVPNGNAVVDVCGVCAGDNSTCKDCSGVPNGNAVVDVCGICGGDGTVCKDCLGVPNGDAKLDRCGVCGGDGSSCLDCAGSPNGSAVLDVCGVCNGDGSSCADCAGVPNGSSVVDACGICGGNGTSCQECHTVKLKINKAELIAKAKTLHNKTLYYDGRAINCDKNPVYSKEILGSVKTLKKYLRIVRKLVTKVEICGEEQCTKKVNKFRLKKLQVLTSKLYYFSRKSNYNVRSACGNTYPPGKGATTDLFEELQKNIDDCPTKACR